VKSAVSLAAEAIHARRTAEGGAVRAHGDARAALTSALDADDIARVLWINDTPATHGTTERHRRLARAIVAHILREVP